MILFVGLAKKILIENDLYQTARNGRISDQRRSLIIDRRNRAKEKEGNNSL